VQNGYLAIRAPENRIITGAFSDIILQGKERECLLTAANDLLDVLANADKEAPLHALTLENTFSPRQFLGSIIGGVAGFCLGGLIGVLLLVVGFLFREDSSYSFQIPLIALLWLIPVLALGGAFLGHFIGNKLIQFKLPNKASHPTGSADSWNLTRRPTE
jgi:hypothetical protein